MNVFLVFSVFASGAALEDGALIYLENSNTVVEKYTDSKISHVAIALNQDDRTWVYEATPGRVRRISLDEFYDEIGELNDKRWKKMRVFVMRPRQQFDDNQVDAMREYLEQQVGRRYSVRSYVRGREGDGIHCAELLSQALSRTGRVEFEKTQAVSPGHLVQSVRDLYADARAVRVQAPATTISWCSRSCASWQGVFSWWRWACHETWTICR